MNTLCFISSDVLLSSRYDLINENMNWIQANAYCKHHYRAKLVMINSQADQLRLQAYLETLDGQPVLCCTHTHARTHAHTHTHTHTFNGPLSGTTWVSRYQKGKTSLDFTEARDTQWHWHQLGHMQVCTLPQTDNHASTPQLCFFTGRMPFLPANQQRQSTEDTTASFCVVTVH